MYSDKVEATHFEIEGRSKEECRDKLYSEYGDNYEILNWKKIPKGGWFLGIGQHEVMRAVYIVNNHREEPRPADTERDKFTKSRDDYLQKMDPSITSTLQIAQLSKKLDQISADMLKPRNVVLPAAIGFTVSFLICIIATHHFLVSLLRGAIFAVVFAAIAAGIVILYERFLAVDTDSGMPSSGADKKGDKTGTTVDLTIGDANLADDGQGPQFFVANNKLPLNTEDTIKSGSQMKKSDSEIQDAGDDMQNIPMSGSGTSSARMATLKTDLTSRQAAISKCTVQSVKANLNLKATSSLRRASWDVMKVKFLHKNQCGQDSFRIQRSLPASMSL